MADKLKLGLVTEASVVKVHDGDTFTVQVTREFGIRLTDTDKLPLYFNTAELSTALGKETAAFLKKFLVGKTVTLFIPTNDPLKLTDISSFDRIIAEVYVDGKKLTDILLENGYGEFKDYKHVDKKP